MPDIATTPFNIIPIYGKFFYLHFAGAEIGA